jgi:hypothetical protein
MTKVKRVNMDDVLLFKFEYGTLKLVEDNMRRGMG